MQKVATPISIGCYLDVDEKGVDVD